MDSINSIHTQAGALCGLRWEEKMKVLGHENPAHQQEAQRLAELPQHVDKIAPETLAFKRLHGKSTNRRAALCASPGRCQLNS